MTEENHFTEFLSAALLDAACENKLSQLQIKIFPPGGTKEKVIRIIVVPEEMDHILGGS